MTCERIELDCRPQGSLLPNTRVTITEDDVVLDNATLASYTWQVQGATNGYGSAWTKNAGITVVGTEVVIVWAAADLGACYPGQWVLELTGTLGGLPRKAQLLITIDPEVA
jgi:hypothetical protein